MTGSGFGSKSYPLHDVRSRSQVTQHNFPSFSVKRDKVSLGDRRHTSSECA